MDSLKFIDYMFTSIDQVFLNRFFCLFIAIIALINKNNNNYLLLVSVILLMKILDIFYFNDFMLNSPHIKNYMFYVFYFFYDLVVLLAVIFRLQLFKVIAKVYIKAAVFLVPDVNKVHRVNIIYQRNIDEFKLVLLYFVYCLTSVFMVLEYALREFFSNEILYIYYLYTPIKVTLFCYEIYLLFIIGVQTKKQYSVMMKD